MAFLSVALLFMFAAHYVDDSFSVEPTLFAESSFATFQAFHRLLGFRMKEAKSKFPLAHTLWALIGLSQRTLFVKNQVLPCPDL